MLTAYPTFDIISFVNQPKGETDETSKQTAENKKLDDETIGSMWLCAANFALRNWTEPNWHGVVVKEVGIEHACARRDGMYVESTERNPFNFGDCVCFRGYVGRMMFNTESKDYFVGFFETREEAENAYRALAKKLIDDIASKILKD